MAGLTAEAKSPYCVFGTNSSPCSCKSNPENSASPVNLPCPQCGSKKLWRDAKRYTVYGDEIQRWLCRDCGLRFSDPNDVKKGWSNQEKTARKQLSNEIKMATDLVTSSQRGVTETKNLVAEQQTSEVLRRNESSTAIGKSVEYEFWMLKQGYAKSTIESRVKIMKRLTKLGACLYDPESIKEITAKQPWSDGRKEIVVEAYTNFLIMAGGKWDPPKYHRIEKIPFIPTEQEIDQLTPDAEKNQPRCFNHSKKQECE
jgi:transposase-like protein